MPNQPGKKFSFQNAPIFFLKNCAPARYHYQWHYQDFPLKGGHILTIHKRTDIAIPTPILLCNNPRPPKLNVERTVQNTCCTFLCEILGQRKKEGGPAQAPPPFGDHYLLHSESLLVHVTQVEHGLSVVLLFKCQPVVKCRRFIVHVCAIAVVVIVPKLHPGVGISCR